MTDELTGHDKNGIQYLLFAVEDKLAKADDVNVTLEQIIALGATIIPPGPDREAFKRHLRILVQPLVDLELKRRKPSELTRGE